MLLTEIAIKWKSAIFLLMLLVTIFGAMAYVQLPKEADPDVAIPFIVISTAYEGVAPADIESLITLPIERQLKGLEGVKEVTSYSSEGASNISVEFMTDQDLADALQRVKDKVDAAKGDLPQDLQSDPMVFDVNISDFPVMEVAISGDIPEAQLKKIADELQDAIEGIRGVQEVNISGVRDRIILVEFNYTRLQAYRLDVMEIVTALQQENVNIPGGSMNIGKGKYLLRIPGEFTDPSIIDNLVLTSRNGTPIYFKDVAQIRDTFDDMDSYARLDGINTVSLSIKKRTGENMILMASQVKEALLQAEDILPASITLTLTTDHSTYVEEMLSELENSLATGLLLVVLVLFFFLGKTNSIFTALAIPFSMLMTFIVFQQIGVTINIVVLFGLIMALGLLVDDAIVIVENIYRHMQEGMDRVTAARAAAAEVGWPVVAATVVKICAFLPLMFWPGITGDFMKYIPLTMIITLASSLFVALVFNPVLCSTFMSVKKNSQLRDEDDVDLGKVMSLYDKFLRLALNHRKISILAAVAFMIVPILLYVKVSNLGVEFFPASDPESANIQVTAPQGTNAMTTLQTMLAIESAVEGEPNVKYVLTLVGGDGVADFSSQGSVATHLGRMTVEFIDYKDRVEPSMDTINRIREKLQGLPGVEIVVDYQQSGPPVGQAVDIELSGPDSDVLGSLAADLREKISVVNGLVDLKDSFIKSKPEIRINVDREKAALLGLSTSTIATIARGAISGIKVGVYREGDDEYDIIVRLPEDKRQSIDDIKNLQIPARSGDYIPLSSVADVELSSGFGQINRIDYKRVVNVTANASEERGGAAVLNDVKTVLADYQLPAGYNIKYTGEDQEQQEASAFLSKAFLVVVFLILMVLLVEFNSVAQTLIILATVLISIGGVFWGLLITQTTFGIIMTGIGIIALAGIVVNNGIIMIDYTNKLIAKGYEQRDAIVRAGVVRFRPVMLTAVTSILGMLPMSIGYGINFAHLRIEKGAEMSQWWVSMANAIIFGLAFATVLTLVIVPVLYSFTGKRKGEAKPRKPRLEAIKRLLNRKKK